jgi:cytochrome c oxidase subunit 3
VFFGGLFAAYMIYRVCTETFRRGQPTLDITLGTVNTMVLIMSSLTMALAVHAAAVGHRRTLMIFLVLTMILGAVFLGIKGVEYYDKFTHHHIPGATFHFEEGDPAHAQLFFSLYFAMTGLHAAHMVIGVGMLSVLLFMAWRRPSSAWHTPVEMIGLYWHFVDII